MTDLVKREDENDNEKTEFSHHRDSLIGLHSSKLLTLDLNASTSSFPDFSSAELDSSAAALPARRVRFSFEANRPSIVSPMRRSILKTTLSPAEIIAVQVAKERRAALLEKMKEGTVLWKYSSESKCEKRTFTISKDESELIWKHVGKITSIKTTRVAFASVKSIVYGPRTPGFKTFDWKVGKSWLCFSVICEGRNVDIECPDLETFQTWFFGIQELAPLSHKFLTAPQVNWRRALFKTAQISLACEMPLEDVWHEMVKMARAPEGSETPCSRALKDKLVELQQEAEHVELKMD